MLIALYRIITANNIIPGAKMQIPGIAGAIFICIIMIIGIKITLSLVGVHSSGRTSGMLVKAIIDGIGYLTKKLIEAIGWIIRKTVEAIPKVYHGSKNFFKGTGMNDTISTLLALLIAIIFIIIII